MRIDIDVTITVEVECWYDSGGGLEWNLAETGKSLKDMVTTQLDLESYRDIMHRELQDG